MNQILMLDKSGRPYKWITPEYGVSLLLRNAISWSLGSSVQLYAGVSRKTGLRSTFQVPSIIAVRNQSFVGRVSFNRSTLFARDDKICCYCAKRFPNSMLTIEHIVPISRGGSTSWLNCACACRSCNGRKGGKLLAESGMELVYLPYIPSATEALILSGRHIIADQMDFLKACLPSNSRILAGH